MRVLVVDDSPLYRKLIADIVSHLDFVESVETAATGQEALAKAKSWRPDVITLDVDLPDLSGLRVLRELNAAGSRAAVVMVSALTEAGTGVATLASELGAVDLVLKPRSGTIQAGVLELTRRIGFVLKALTAQRPMAVTPRRKPALVERSSMAVPTRRPDVVAIGASTGGPVVLGSLVEWLPRELRVPVLITLHLAEGFTRLFAESLARRAAVAVCEAKEGLLLAPGTVYLAPGGKQMGVARSPDGAGVVLRVNDDPPEKGCRPSVDYLFRSVAEVYGDRALAVILTGMGRDGVQGLQQLKARGSFVIAQDEASCVVFGMPAAAIEAGVVDLVASPENILALLIAFAQGAA